MTYDRKSEPRSVSVTIRFVQHILGRGLRTVAGLVIVVLLSPMLIVAEEAGEIFPRGKRPYPYTCTQNKLALDDDNACQIACSKLGAEVSGGDPTWAAIYPFKFADRYPQFKCKPSIVFFVAWDFTGEDAKQYRGKTQSAIKYATTTVEAALKSRNRILPIKVYYYTASKLQSYSRKDLNLGRRKKALYFLRQGPPEKYQEAFRAHGETMSDASAMGLADRRPASPERAIPAGVTNGQGGIVTVINLERALKVPNPDYLPNVVLHEVLHLFGFVHPESEPLMAREVSPSAGLVSLTGHAGAVVENNLKLGEDEGR